MRLLIFLVHPQEYVTNELTKCTKWNKIKIMVNVTKQVDFVRDPFSFKCRRYMYMAEISPIRRETPSNQSINPSNEPSHMG